MDKPTVIQGGKKTYIYKLDPLVRWEEIYRELRPHHSYVIWSNWGERVRDFIAYVKVQQVHEFQKTGTHRTYTYTRLINAYESVEQGEIPDDIWQEYVNDPNTLTDEILTAKEAFEALSAAERADMSKGSYHSTRTHADGSVINEQTGKVTPLPEDDLLAKVLGYTKETHYGLEHCGRWMRAAVGMGYDGFKGVPAMTAKEASKMAVKYKASRWEPVARAIRDVEIGFTDKSKSVDAQLEDTLKIINERPDVEVRKYNPDTNTMDVLSPLTVDKPQIDPSHKDEFIEYIQRERNYIEWYNGRTDVAIKGKVYEGYIEDIESGEHLHSQIMFMYDQYKSWLDGDFCQQTAGGGGIYASGIIVEDLSKPVSHESKWPLIADTYVTDGRNGMIIPFDQIRTRRDELTDIKYRLETDAPTGMRQINWFAYFNNEKTATHHGCLCFLPLNKESDDRWIEPKKVKDLIADGWKVLTPQQYADNQRYKNSREDRFSNFRLNVQYTPDDKPLGICPTQRDLSGGWIHDAELFARMTKESAGDSAQKLDSKDIQKLAVDLTQENDVSKITDILTDLLKRFGIGN